MKILVACEESQTVCKAFRKRGHTSYSCDIIECSGGRPEWHIINDVLPLLDGDCVFETENGDLHKINNQWDMIIAFPPCTRLCNTGQWCLKHGTEEYKNKKRKEQKQAIDFFLAIVNADCEKIAIENPVGIMSTHFRKPDQIIQPFQFGDPHKKTTCLWLKNLPKLEHTNVVEVSDFKAYVGADGKTSNYSDWINPKDKNGKYLNYNSPECKKIRSKTFPGIADAMAEQWG